ncbi:hypothetical protein D3C73_942320 [compost metagenome]
MRGLGALDDRCLRTAHLQRQRIEKVLIEALDAIALQACGENAGEPVDALGNAFKTLRAVIHRIKTGDVGQQHLGGADIRVGLLPPDMLLAGLQCHAQCGATAGVLGDTDDSAWNRSLVLVPAGKKGRMRAAVAHGDAKALGRTEHHVGAQLTRRRQQQQAQQVGADAGQRLLGMQMIDQRSQIADLAVGVGVLQQRTEHLVLLQVFHRVHDQFQAKAFGTGPHHGDRLGVAVFINEKQIASGLGNALGQGHRLGRRRGLIQQRSIGQLQPGQVDDHLLEIEQRLEPALRDLGLVRRVSGVPPGIFQHIAQDDSRGDRAVIAHADQAGPDLVLLGVTAQLGQRGFFVKGRRQVERPVEENARRHGLLDQLDATAQAKAVEHRLLLGSIRAEVTAQESIGVA